MAAKRLPQRQHHPGKQQPPRERRHMLSPEQRSYTLRDVLCDACEDPYGLVPFPVPSVSGAGAFERVRVFTSSHVVYKSADESVRMDGSPYSLLRPQGPTRAPRQAPAEGHPSQGRLTPTGSAFPSESSPERPLPLAISAGAAQKGHPRGSLAKRRSKSDIEWTIRLHPAQFGLQLIRLLRQSARARAGRGGRGG